MQRAILIIAIMYNGSFQREGWVHVAHGWEGNIYEMLVYVRERGANHSPKGSPP
jgi:hypothetical protein